MGFVIFFFQVTFFHELGLAKGLQQISLIEWEKEFFHVDNRIAFYVKKFYTDQRFGEITMQEEIEFIPKKEL